MEGRTDIDAEARAQVEHAHDIGLHWDPPLGDYSSRNDMCRLCGDASFSCVVRADRRGGHEVDFVVDGSDTMRDRPRPDGVLCWKCLYTHVDHLDPGLAVMRRLLLSTPEGAQFLPTLRRVEEARRFRNVTGTCELCGRKGAAIRGPTDVVYCLVCYRSAQAVRDAEMARWETNRRIKEEKFDAAVMDYMRAMWAIAREDAQCAFFAMQRRGELTAKHEGAPPNTSPAPPPEEASPRIETPGWSLAKESHKDGRPPTPPVVTARDAQAKQAIEFLDAEVERALKHTTRARDLMGDSTRIRDVHLAFQPAELSRPMLLRFLCSLSVLRQVIETGSTFCGYTGDELIHERMTDYDAIASRLDVGVHDYVKAASEGGVLVHGGTKESRARVAGALRRISDYRTADTMFSRPSAPFQYIEAEDFYAMTPDAQEEVRRRMLITPPYVTVFGADDLDRFIEETPRRATARVVTYLFMNGHDHVDLNRGDVHASPNPPTIPRPKD
ncbi:MAG: hypothetical protein U0441_17950 [Polyangiaceae bacterium]